MRLLTPAPLALALALALTLPAQAQPPKKVTIDEGGVHIGFGAPGDGAGSKTGFWAPVYVQITAGLDRIGPADGNIVVSTTDSDDMENSYRVPLPPLNAKEQTTVIGYVRTGTTGSNVNVTIRDDRGYVISSQKGARTGYSAAAPGAFLYVTAGGNAQASALALQRALRPQQKAGDPNNVQVQAEDDPLHGTSCAYVSNARDLPTRWFGYHGADLLILETGSKTFTEDLLNDKSSRKEALAEWVRRGGRLVISVGHEHQLTKALLDQLQILPVTLNGTVRRPSLSGLGRWVGTQERILPRRRAQGGEEVNAVELVKIGVPPGKGVQTLVEETGDTDRDRWPVVVQASAGLGRMIHVGIDLDREPFTDWPGQGKFWQKLNTEARPNAQAEKAGVNPNFPGGMPMGGMPGWDPGHGDVGTLMVDRLEAFTEVPVISFGWVALFILVYIIVVGPLDYFFLKKVVKRLELTWITFPAVVLAVSALAYVSAYYLKGNDLRINKVDLVDIVADTPETEAGAAPQAARGARAYGTTWFTVFSPRIQNYTVGVEPGTGAWVPEVGKDAPNPHSVMVTWMGKPENVWGGTGRTSGSPSLFRRPYDYAPDASGLRGVPIQVWSTKTFTASWQAALAEDRPLVRADLQHTKGPRGEVLTGSVTSELPARLDHAVLFYANTKYDLGTLEPGTTKKLDPPLVVGGGGGAHNWRIEEWFADVHVPLMQNNPWERRNPNNTMTSAEGIIKDLMFGAKDTTGGHPHNATARYLDESWRLNRPGEAVVVGKLPRLEENGEQISKDPVSPSRLWLGELPEPGKPRPDVPGKMTQEAYVRIFIPVTTK